MSTQLQSKTHLLGLYKADLDLFWATLETQEFPIWKQEHDIIEIQIYTSWR